jgi:hypothetical protein
MTTWITVDASFTRQRDTISKLLELHFGPEHKQTYNPHSKRKMDNHGDWQFGWDGKVKLRYKKHLVWFLLMAGQYADPPSTTRYTRIR